MRKLVSRTILTVAALATTITCASAISNIQTTKVTMGASYTSDVLLGNDAIHQDETASTMIGSDVVAAVNGGFFNSYYSGTGDTFPGNCPIIYGTIIDEGMVINGGDTTNMIGFTYDNKVLIDQVKVTPACILNNSLTISAWSVNQLTTDTTAIHILTDIFDYSYTVPTGSTVVVVTNNKVTSVLGGGTYTVANGTYHLVLGSAAVANLAKWDNVPQVGDTLELSQGYSKTAWEDVKTAVTGGRMLVMNGTDVTSNATYNAIIDDTADSKQDNTSSLGRSFAAVMQDGSVLFGTATGTFPEIASYLIGQGATSALSLDGGASSMLYNGSSYLTSAGRQLASILAISTDRSTATDTPDLPTVKPVVDANTPSDWAVATIATCESKNLVPSWMNYGYKNYVTRQDFCKILAQFIQTTTGDSLESVIKQAGNTYSDYTFNDTSDYHIQCIAAMGIVNGSGGGNFDPTGLLTREQAATMILRMVNLLGSAPQVTTATFTDQAQISDWAVDGVATITGAKIMNGNGSTFDPQDNYTKEQAYQTVLNVYNTWSLK